MSNTIPLPEPAYTLPFPDDDELAFSARQMREYAAAVTAAKDAEIERLRDQLHLAEVVRAAQVEGLTQGAAGWRERANQLEAEVAGLREDAERLDFLLHKLPGDSLRYVLGELSDTSDEAEFRAAIDAARKQKP